MGLASGTPFAAQKRPADFGSPGLLKRRCSSAGLRVGDEAGHVLQRQLVEHDLLRQPVGVWPPTPALPRMTGDGSTGSFKTARSGQRTSAQGRLRVHALPGRAPGIRHTAENQQGQICGLCEPVRQAQAVCGGTVVSGGSGRLRQRLLRASTPADRA